MRALITGITGQDGSYMAELLLNRGYEVFGLQKQHEPFRPHRSDSRGYRTRRRRPDGPMLAGQRNSECETGRGIQPRCAKFRAGLVEPTGIDRGRDGAGRNARTRGDSEAPSASE